MKLPGSLGEALAAARGRIALAEARLLLREASGCSAAQIIAYPERALDAAAAQRYLDWLSRRAQGEPVAYLLGVREFYGRPFRTCPAVLIPRADTECLVDAALQRLRTMAAPRVLDLGTGSGAIALSLALEAPHAQLTAIDAAPEALAVARENAEHLGATLRWLCGDWFAPVAGERFAMIVSNPPYIAEGDAHLDLGDLRFEPRSALVSGGDGLADLRRIAAAAPHHLEGGGYVLLEHGFAQAQAVQGLLAEVGFTAIETLTDLAGQPRVTLGRMR